MQTFRSTINHATAFFPSKVMTNHDLEKLVETNDQWIVERTGIKERRVVEPGQAASDLGVEAAKRLIEREGISVDEINAIIVATITEDMPFPNTASLVQKKLGAFNAWCFDLSAACSGFVYALTVADQFMRTGHTKNVLLIGVDVMSAITDYKDRTTCVLFGDGAGAVFLRRGDEGCNNGIIDSMLASDGRGGDHLYMKAGGSLNPATHETVEKKLHYIRQDGQTVFKWAVKEMARVTTEIIERNQFKLEDIDIFVPHQANIRIIESCAKRLKLKQEQVVINIDRYGNTTAATIPTALALAQEEGRLKPGMLVLLASVGAGFASGSVLLRWGSNS